MEIIRTKAAGKIRLGAMDVERRNGGRETRYRNLDNYIILGISVSLCF